MELASSGIRDIGALARRVHQRWLEYRRRYPGRSVPVSDTLSRILEHDPEYTPLRRRARLKPRRLLRNPGVFTLKEIADALETTVGDLLGEPHFTDLRDRISDAERRQLRDAVALLRNLFDLDEPALAAEFEEPPFPVPRSDFIVSDYDYPRPMHVWIAAATDPELDVRHLREVREPNLRIVRVTGDSMAPELPDGCKVVVDTDRTTPVENALVAVYIHGGPGAVIGRWRASGGTPTLRKTNPEAQPVVLPPDGQWFVWGTITTIVRR